MSTINKKAYQKTNVSQVIADAVGHSRKKQQQKPVKLEVTGNSQKVRAQKQVYYVKDQYPINDSYYESRKKPVRKYSSDGVAGGYSSTSTYASEEECQQQPQYYYNGGNQYSYANDYRAAKPRATAGITVVLDGDVVYFKEPTKPATTATEGAALTTKYATSACLVAPEPSQLEIPAF